MRTHWQSTSPVLTVCILSIDERAEMLGKLLEYLDGQRDPRVELLVNCDNRIKTVGRKRQECLDAATGNFCCYIDDDDWVSFDYVPSLGEACSRYAVDVISYDQQAQINGGNVFRVNWSLKNIANEQTKVVGGIYQDIRRPPWHLCPWKSSLAKRFAFEDSSWGEDWAWVSQLIRAAQTEWHIDKTLYHYRFDEGVTATDVRAMQRTGR